MLMDKLAVYRQQHGFTLLEAIVALAILAMSALALYAWLNSSLMILKRVDDVYRTAAVVDSTIEWVAALDPYKHQNGSEDIAGMQVQWQFVPINDPRKAYDMSGNLSVNDIQLFRAEITIRQEQQVVAQFELIRIGLQAKRGIDELIF